MINRSHTENRNLITAKLLLSVAAASLASVTRFLQLYFHAGRPAVVWQLTDCD
jgi:hypothetical protein